MSVSSVRRGASAPLGATLQDGGVNFSVFSKNATLMELLLFDNADAIAPARVIRLDPQTHRTYHYWHVFVPAIRPGQIYAFRAAGPFEPERGLRFDSNRVLLDPYGRAVTIPKG
jgi:glycogen operon protein